MTESRKGREGGDERRTGVQSECSFSKEREGGTKREERGAEERRWRERGKTVGERVSRVEKRGDSAKGKPRSL